MAGHRLLTKTLAVLLLIIAVTDSIRARVIIGGLSFQQMFEKADFVAIATVRKTKDTSKRKKLIDVDVDASPTLPSDQFPDEVIGVETEFTVRLTLKGSKDVKKL